MSSLAIPIDCAAPAASGWLSHLPSGWPYWAVSISLHALLLSVSREPAHPVEPPPLRVMLSKPAPGAPALPTFSPPAPTREPTAVAKTDRAPVLAAPADSTPMPLPMAPPPQQASPLATAGPLAAAPAAPASAIATPAAPDKPLADGALLSRNVFQLMNARKRYPLMARRLGLEGVVVIEAVINERGQLHSAEIRQSSGHELLDQDALALLKSVLPLQLDSHRLAANTRVQIPLRYALE